MSLLNDLNDLSVVRNVQLARMILSGLLSAAIAFYAFRRKSLDFSGALCAWIVGLMAWYSGVEFGILLLFFFFSSSKATKYKAHLKKQREENYQIGGQRNWEQVLANGGIPTLICFLYVTLQTIMYQSSSEKANQLMGSQWIYVYNAERFPLKTFLMAAYLGCYCCNCADTWSSEFGITNSSRPRFILKPWRTVEHGTNGGVSWLGYIAAILSGMCFGILSLFLTHLDIILYTTTRSLFPWTLPNTQSNQFSFVAFPSQWYIIPLCLFSALLGTTLDSLMGATLEASYYCKKQQKIVSKPSKSTVLISGVSLLTGSHVNFLSGLLTAIISGIAALYIFRDYD